MKFSGNQFKDLQFGNSKTLLAARKQIAISQSHVDMTSTLLKY